MTTNWNNYEYLTDCLTYNKGRRGYKMEGFPNRTGVPASFTCGWNWKQNGAYLPAGHT